MNSLSRCRFCDREFDFRHWISSTFCCTECEDLFYQERYASLDFSEDMCYSVSCNNCKMNTYGEANPLAENQISLEPFPFFGSVRREIFCYLYFSRKDVIFLQMNKKKTPVHTWGLKWFCGCDVPHSCKKEYGGSSFAS